VNALAFTISFFAHNQTLIPSRTNGAKFLNSSNFKFGTLILGRSIRAGHQERERVFEMTMNA
jgi:hypothetical protein